MLTTPQHRVFFSGDSGYGSHFEEIKKKIGQPDFALLDMGQYDKDWPYVHMNPVEATQAADELETKMLIPAHVGKFSMLYL